METLHTVLKRGCSIWDKELVPEAELRARLSRVRQGMEERGLDLVLVYGDSRRFGHLAFVSHFMPKNRGALAAIPRQGAPALVVQEPDRNNPFSRTLTWFEEVRSAGRFGEGLGAALEARGIRPKRVGLAGVEEQMAIREWDGLARMLEGAEFFDFGAHLGSLRLIKSASQQALLKKAGRVLEDALARFARELRPGQKEYEIAALAELEARRQGVEDFQLLVARSTEPHVGLRPAGAATIHKGESLLVSVAASCQRHWAELGRTFSLGRPQPDLSRGHALARAIFRQLVAGIKVGSPAGAAPDWLKEVPAAVTRSLKAYGLGNGLGLDLVEEPFLGREGAVIEPGMALTLRVCLTGDGAGPGLISQPFLVTEGGLKPLLERVEELVVVEDHPAHG